MIGTFALVTLQSFFNRIVSRLKRLRNPRYLIGAIAGLAYFYLSNNPTLSTIFGRDLMTPKALSERLSHITEVALGYVLRS